MSRHPFRPLPGSRLAHTADIITGTELTSRWECDSTHSKGANRKWLGASLTKPEKWIRHTPQQNLKTLHPVKKEKRLEREVACHSHFGVEIRLWVHYTSLWCEVCLSAVSQRKESIRWAMFPFFMCGSNFERSRLCWRLISILLCEKLKKKFGSEIVEIAMTFETPSFTTSSKKIGLLRLTSSLQEHKLWQLNCKLYVLKSHHYFSGYWKGR